MKIAWKITCFGSLALITAIAAAQPAAARSLDIIRQRGSIGECAHPNALPFSSRRAKARGFQIELGEAIAKQLGVALEPVWIIGPRQIRRAGCDIVTDAIAEPGVQGETGLQLSRPYYRTGIVLAVPIESPVKSLASIGPHAKIGVLGGSVASMVFSQHGFTISDFGFEDDMLQELANGGIAGAVVSRAAAGYYNVTHPGHAVRLVDIDSLAPDFSWNVAVGMVKPDAALSEAIDRALKHLTDDGTIRRIYARYGITLQPPKE